MKIEGSRTPDSQEVQIRAQRLKKQDTTPATQANLQKGTRSDQLHLSGRAKEMEEMQNVINQLPEIRIDKVEALRQSIKAATYNVDSVLIAGKILEEI